MTSRGSPLVIALAIRGGVAYSVTRVRGTGVVTLFGLHVYVRMPCLHACALYHVLSELGLGGLGRSPPERAGLFGSIDKSDRRQRRSANAVEQVEGSVCVAR